MKIAITGNRGFIGSHLFDHLTKEADVIGVDIKDDKDILDLTPKNFEGVDYVFHLAAEVSVPESIDDPIKSARTNISGTLNVLECAKQAGVKRVIFSSSAAVYGINKRNDSTGFPYSENLECNPLSPYAASKMAGEVYCKLYSELYGLDTVCLRYFNVFGDGMKANSQYSAALAIFLDKKRKNESLPVFGGLQKRDFIYVEDVVEANVQAMLYMLPLKGECINIGTGKSHSISEIARMVSTNIDYFPQRKGEPNNSRADIMKAKRILLWKPTTSVIDWLICGIQN